MSKTFPDVDKALITSTELNEKPDYMKIMAATLLQAKRLKVKPKMKLDLDASD
jgi:hypothetical protein